ncbi:MAG: DNA polymerase III subunit delta', partial [Parvibaculum sp.]
MKGDTDNPGIDAWDRLEGIPDPLENPLLAGHGDVLDHLALHYASGRMHHAWLVTRPRGIGKATKAARFAAQVFRNPDPATAPGKYLPVGPDDATERRIASGAHPNLLHLRRPWDDRRKRWKTRLSVDEIRRLNHFFTTTPGQNTWRIVIVDTTDDLNTQAANALLKNLEEPPPRTLFFVLAHSAKGLLATIR